MGKGYRLDAIAPGEKQYIPLEDYLLFEKEQLMKEYQTNSDLISEYIRSNYESVSGELLETLDELFKKIIRMQEAGEKEDIRYIHFFFLSTSIISDSNEIQINCFDNNSYMDYSETMAIWHPDFILDYHLKTIETFDKLAKRKVIGYGHREYMKMKQRNFAAYSLIIAKFLAQVVPGIIELESYQRMDKSEALQIVYGGYMDSGIQLYGRMAATNS